MGRKKKTDKAAEEPAAPIDAIEVGKASQEELPNMPARSELGKAAIAYVDVVDEMAESTKKWKKKKGAAQDKLVKLMDEQGKTTINVEGFVFTRKHIDEDKIQVKRPSVRE